MIVLRDYQADVVQRTREALRRSPRVLVQAPTGAGKTAIAAFMIGQTVARLSGAWFICHRAELIEGTSKTFSRYGIPHSFVASGLPMNLASLVKICSIDTLKNRIAALPLPRIAIVDEAHHCGAAGWASVIQFLAAAGVKIIGLSATPRRLDGIGLDAHFDELVLGPAVAWLIEHGHLSGYRMFAPHVPDMKGVRRNMGDFARGEAEGVMSKPKLTGDAIAHWSRHARNLRTVAFGVTVAHSHHIAAQFREAGIPADHLDGTTPMGERKRIISDYASGRLQVLTNVDLFGEGFDLSSIAGTDVTIDAVMQMRPTQSLSLHLQQIGRSLRPAPGKTAIILDHAGNSQRHGFPDDEREWSLEGREKGKKSANDNGPPPPATCSSCFSQVRRPAPRACPYCGNALSPDPKPVEVADGELLEVTEADKRRIRADLKREEAGAKTLDDLVALGARRGYRNPQKWAFLKWSNSKWRHAS